MFFRPFLLAFIFGLLIGTGIPKYLSKKVNKEIASNFEVENYTLKPLSFKAEILKSLPSNFSNENFMKIQVEDKLLGYAYFSKAPSKTDQFDYLVLLNPELVVVCAKVLVYREDYGGEIGSKRWLSQFTGKTVGDKLEYGSDIMAISGATISVKSMTNAVDELLQCLKILKSKQLL